MRESKARDMLLYVRSVGSTKSRRHEVGKRRGWGTFFLPLLRLEKGRCSRIANHVSCRVELPFWMFPRDNSIRGPISFLRSIAVVSSSLERSSTASSIRRADHRCHFSPSFASMVHLAKMHISKARLWVSCGVGLLGNRLAADIERRCTTTGIDSRVVGLGWSWLALR
jgi:hypothetical protein